jgi:hypothetical protein
MSMKIHAIGRTVKILRPYAVEQKSGRNGNFESRMVMFTLATDRDYRQATTNADGTVTQERHTDFFACRATGPIADLFAKYCNAVKKDENGNDKLVSRRIAVEGHLEKYNAQRTEQVQLNNGQIIQVTLPEEREVVVVESIEFLDANPTKSNAGTTATATVIQAQPVANAQPIAQAPVAYAPVAQAVAPVAEAMPVAPVAGVVTSEMAPF